MRPDRPLANAASYAMVTGSFQCVKGGGTAI